LGTNTVTILTTHVAASSHIKRRGILLRPPCRAPQLVLLPSRRGGALGAPPRGAALPHPAPTRDGAVRRLPNRLMLIEQGHHGGLEGAVGPCHSMTLCLDDRSVLRGISSCHDYASGAPLRPASSPPPRHHPFFRAWEQLVEIQSLPSPPPLLRAIRQPITVTYAKFASPTPPDTHV
jgi:hypothetical protein